MSAEIVALLASIDASLKSLVARQVPAQASPPSPAAVASDRDLDGPYGDPIIKAKDPRDWTGPTMAGKKFSECPAEYLDALADRYDYFAVKADEANELTASGKPKSHYSRLDAARARGWAARIRSGAAKPSTAAPVPAWSDEDSVPF